MENANSGNTKGGGEGGGEIFRYEDQNFTTQDIYRVLGFSTPPSDRELEAKIIMFMRKYNGYTNGQDPDSQRLYDFFNQLYDHFFDENGDSGSSGLSSSNGSGDNKETPQWLIPKKPDNQIAGTRENKPVVPREDPVVKTVQNLEYSKDVLNPILKQTIQRVISIDSRYRHLNSINTFSNSISTNFTIELSEPLRDVLSLKLYSYQIPYTWYTVNKDYGSNYFILKGNSPGLEEEQYKVEITPGNYSIAELTSAINTSIQRLHSVYTDVSFGKTAVSYNTNTTLATFKVDLQKAYQEPHYYLDWTTWTTPNINRDVSNSGITSIAQYLGFDSSNNSLCSAYSVRNTLPLKSVTENDDSKIPLYWLDASNNYFDFVQYSGSDVEGLDASGVTLLQQFRIDLTLSTGSIYTRNQLMAEIQERLSKNDFLDSFGSSLERLAENNGLYSYFKLSLSPNRFFVPYVPSSQFAIRFPYENPNNFSTGHQPIWIGNNSCFRFDRNDGSSGSLSINLNRWVAEYPLFPSNYVIYGYPTLEISFNTYGYGNNRLVMTVPKSDSTGYTDVSYSEAIVNAIQNRGVETPILFNGIPINDVSFGTFTNRNFTYVDNPVPTFSFDFQYLLQNKDYTHVFIRSDISINNAGFVWLRTDNGYENDAGILTNDYYDFSYNAVEDVRNGRIVNTFTYQMAEDIALDQTYKFRVRSQYASILKIIPRETQYAPSLTVPFKSSTNYQSGIEQQYYDYSDIDVLLRDLNNSLTSYDTSGNSSNPLIYSVFTKELVQNNSVSYWRLFLTVQISKYLTQNDVVLKMYDVCGNDIYYPNDSGKHPDESPFSSWGTYLKFADSSYNLATSHVVQGSSAIFATTSVILNNTNNFFYFRPQPYAKGLVTNQSSTTAVKAYYNDIRIQIPVGKYSVNTLFQALNQAFAAIPLTQETTIDSVFNPTNQKFYCRLIVRIQKVFGSKDYSLDFYDLTNYVNCYIGSTVRNTTWDSTIGWILGFHQQTVYDLSSYTMVGTAVDISGELSVNTNLFSYFLISVDDFNQNRLNDGLVTILNSDHQMQLPSYSAIATMNTDFQGNVGTAGSATSAENSLTAKQVYTINQILESRKNTSKVYSQGPFVKDIFGFIPLKLPSSPGDIITEFGGTLQNQTRMYFGPVNIRRLQIQLINDKGAIMDLNGADWSFSFICEQLYQKKVT